LQISARMSADEIEADFGLDVENGYLDTTTWHPRL
jgi:hypothetical protein